MKQENILLEKSYVFSLRIVKLYQFLVKNGEFHLSRQLIKSGTSIGANAEEANGCFTKKDFLSKLSISYKEARETRFWLRLLRDSNIITISQAESMIVDCEELLKIIGSSIKTLKKNQTKQQ